MPWGALSNIAWDEIHYATSTVEDENGIPLCEAFFNTAMQFDFFINQCSVNPSIDDAIVLNCRVPLVVNTALCCELFLKSICAYKGAKWGKGKKGHSIGSLLDLSGLKSRFATCVDTRFDVSAELQRVDEAFVSWRYEAEGGPLALNFDFLELLRAFLKDEALRLREKWRPASGKLLCEE